MTEDEVRIYEAERLARWRAWCVKQGFNQDVAEGWMSMSDYVDRGIFAEWDVMLKENPSRGTNLKDVCNEWDEKIKRSQRV